MKSSKQTPLRRLLFRVGVVLKGVDGIVEFACGIALWVFGPGLIVRVVTFLTQQEIDENPHDFVVTHLRHAASHFAAGSEHFAAVYLLAHGVVKIFVVGALLRNKPVAYPISLVVFGGFVLYQVYRIILTHSVAMIALTIFDLIVMWFIWLEYQTVRSRAESGDTA